MVLDVALFWKEVSDAAASLEHLDTPLLFWELMSLVLLQRLLSWLRSKSPRVRLRHSMATATTFEEWKEAAFELDEHLSADLW